MTAAEVKVLRDEAVVGDVEDGAVPMPSDAVEPARAVAIDEPPLPLGQPIEVPAMIYGSLALPPRRSVLDDPSESYSDQVVDELSTRVLSAVRGAVTGVVARHQPRLSSIDVDMDFALRPPVPPVPHFAKPRSLVERWRDGPAWLGTAVGGSLAAVLAVGLVGWQSMAPAPVDVLTEAPVLRREIRAATFSLARASVAPTSRAEIVTARRWRRDPPVAVARAEIVAAHRWRRDPPVAIARAEIVTAHRWRRDPPVAVARAEIVTAHHWRRDPPLAIARAEIVTAHHWRRDPPLAVARAEIVTAHRWRRAPPVAVARAEIVTAHHWRRDPPLAVARAEIVVAALVSRDPPSAIDRSEIVTLVAVRPDESDPVRQALALMGRGDVAGARSILEEPALRDTIDAILMLARSYDPNYLAQVPASNSPADALLAAKYYRRWFERAVASGLVSGDVRIEQLIRSLKNR